MYSFRHGSVVPRDVGGLMIFLFILALFSLSRSFSHCKVVFFRVFWAWKYTFSTTSYALCLTVNERKISNIFTHRHFARIFIECEIRYSLVVVMCLASLTVKEYSHKSNKSITNFLWSSRELNSLLGENGGDIKNDCFRVKLKSWEFNTR